MIEKRFPDPYQIFPGLLTPRDGRVPASDPFLNRSPGTTAVPWRIWPMLSQLSDVGCCAKSLTYPGYDPCDREQSGELVLNAEATR